nr:sulfur carrier protein ThiS [Sphingopyxis sp. JAI108]
MRAPPIWAARQKAKQGGFHVISVILNGEPRQVREGSIADLVASLGLDVKKVAVERNRAIVPRSTLADVALAEGDALEIVHFVGGG